MWMAYEALSRQTGADRVAIEKLLDLGLARLERDEQSPIQPTFRSNAVPVPVSPVRATPPPIALRTPHAV
jgi:hypothetical protein